MRGQVGARVDTRAQRVLRSEAAQSTPPTAGRNPSPRCGGFDDDGDDERRLAEVLRAVGHQAATWTLKAPWVMVAWQRE